MASDASVDVVFFPPLLKDPKPNMLFMESCANIGVEQRSFHLVPNSSMDDARLNTYCSVSRLLNPQGKETVFLAQVDVDLHFPYCKDRVTLYKYFRVEPTQVTPMVLKKL